MFEGTVKSCIFQGIHYDMLVDTDNGYEIEVQDYNAFEVGSRVGMLVKPCDIQVMHKERYRNSFEARLVDETHVEMLGQTFECLPQEKWNGEAVDVTVEVEFDKIDLIDTPEDDDLKGDVRVIIFKGDHYFLTLMTEDRDKVYVDTKYVYDERDFVGIRILPQDIKVK
ncbi:MAG: TOBE domain-containing protein, partial [Bacteroidales bacterium]|nr:TOBE domain-containing protein [Bacteroidales bacterium]